MSKQPIVCIYHTPCNDGLTAAWAVKKAHPDAELRPASHGKPFPLDGLAGRDVVFVDICPTRGDLLKLLEVADVTILDHHKTAEADLKDLEAPNLSVVFDMERSGAGIAWDYYHGDQPQRPWFVDTVEDNDLWRFALPSTKAAIEYMRSLPQTIDAIEGLYQQSGKPIHDLDGVTFIPNNPPLYATERGHAILEFKGIQIQQSVEFAQRKFLGFANGEKMDVYVSNVPFFLCSDVANVLAQKNADEGRVPLGITYYMAATGKWALSFRTIGDFDCSAIAKAFGGGGHKNASGANVDTLPWV